jgi:hypothetical protein
MLRAREEEYQGKLADWEADMEERREIEEAFQVPFLERVFGYDPAGARGNFLTKVAKGQGGGDKKCGACHGEMGNVMVRKLPCECVLHLRCVQRSFAVRKRCPCCEVEFNMVKIPEKEDLKLQVGEYPIWGDGGYFNFI